MAKIYNSDVTKGLAQNAGIQQNVDKTPNELAEKIVPTFETNPAMLRRTNVIAAHSGTATGAGLIYTTPANRDFYLTSITWCITKDAACDATTGAKNITAVYNGASVVLVSLPVITLTAQDTRISLAYNTPVKLDRNSAITSNFAFTAGTCVRSATITGYIVESSA